jgi:putative tricarboxylic transport membrane protein
VLVVLSAIGYGLLRFNWPRAPFVIGIVLGKIAEESLHKALELWGLRFFTRPLSLILIGLIVLTVAYAVYRNVKPRAAKEQQPVAS